MHGGPSPYRGSAPVPAGPAQKVPEPAEQDLVLPGSTGSRLEDLERQHKPLEMENRLLGKGSSPEACQEAEGLQQRNAQLAALTKQL